MKIEYVLTTGNLYRANLLLTLYRVYKPMLIFFLLFFLYTLYSGTLVAFFYGVPLGLISGGIISLITGLITARRNKHYAGERTLVVNKKSYLYTGETFKRETQWSDKTKNWFTPWYVYLDITSLYPVVIRRDVLSEAHVSEIHNLFKK